MRVVQDQFVSDERFRELMNRYPRGTTEMIILGAIICIWATQGSTVRPSIAAVREMLVKSTGKGAGRYLIATVLNEEYGRPKAREIAPTSVSSRGWQSSVAPDHPGVYAVYRGAQLVYIGSSLSISKRLAGHEILRQLRRDGAEPICKWRATAAGEHLAVEFRLIRRLCPPLNSAHNHRRTA